MTALDFYKSLLNTAGLIPRDDGNSLTVKLDPVVPLTIGGKLLVLPTPHIIETYNNHPDELQVFHPTSENVLAKDSPVFNFCKRLYRSAISTAFEHAVEQVVKYINNPAFAASASELERKTVAPFTQVDENTMENLTRLLNKTSANGEHKILDFTVLRGEKFIDGKSYNRVIYVHFPLLNEVLQSDKPFGTKIRKKDKQTIIDLHKLLFNIDEPVISDTDIYIAHPSNDTIAPNFSILTSTFGDIVAHIQEVLSRFTTRITQFDFGDLSWRNELPNLLAIRHSYPAFAGNDGEAIERKTLEQKPEVKVSPLGTVRSITPREPEPAPVKKTESLSYAERRAALAREAQQPRTEYVSERPRLSRHRSGHDTSLLEENTRPQVARPSRFDNRNRTAFANRYGGAQRTYINQR